MIEARFQLEPGRGERIVWTGQPDPRRFFARVDLFLVPFSLLWGSFALYWEASVLGWTGSPPAPPVMAAFGIPFVLLGLYFMVGRFIYQAWLKRRTMYALTNRRALILRDAWGPSVDAIPLTPDLPISTSVRSDGSGTIVFGPTSPFDAIYGNTGLSLFRRGPYTPAFYDVPDIRAVAQIIEEQRTSQPRPKKPR